MKYEELLEKDEWEVKRYEILARDNYTCQDCGCRYINQKFQKRSSCWSISKPSL